MFLFRVYIIISLCAFSSSILHSVYMQRQFFSAQCISIQNSRLFAGVLQSNLAICLFVVAIIVGDGTDKWLQDQTLFCACFSAAISVAGDCSYDTQAHSSSELSDYSNGSHSPTVNVVSLSTLMPFLLKLSASTTFSHSATSYFCSTFSNRPRNRDPSEPE